MEFLVFSRQKNLVKQKFMIHGIKNSWKKSIENWGDYKNFGGGQDFPKLLESWLQPKFDKK